ncbi:hypothetical protein IF2G_02512 [Cordyceps javanica]|nr:hypothetical protein IF2G_02512 [Cordyceps javanica]
MRGQWSGRFGATCWDWLRRPSTTAGHRFRRHHGTRRWRLMAPPTTSSIVASLAGSTPRASARPPSI